MNMKQKSDVQRFIFVVFTMHISRLRGNVSFVSLLLLNQRQQSLRLIGRPNCLLQHLANETNLGATRLIIPGQVISSLIIKIDAVGMTILPRGLSSVPISERHGIRDGVRSPFKICLTSTSPSCPKVRPATVYITCFPCLIQKQSAYKQSAYITRIHWASKRATQDLLCKVMSLNLKLKLNLASEYNIKKILRTARAKSNQEKFDISETGGFRPQHILQISVQCLVVAFKNYNYLNYVLILRYLTFLSSEQVCASRIFGHAL